MSKLREALRLIQMNANDADLVHKWATEALAESGPAEELGKREPDGWYFQYNGSYPDDFITDKRIAEQIKRHLASDETCTEYFKHPAPSKPAGKLVAQSQWKLVPAAPILEVRKQLEGKVGVDFLLAYADFYRDNVQTKAAEPAGEPVGEMVWMAGIPNSMKEVRFYGENFLLPVGTKFYTHPTPEAVRKLVEALEKVAVVAHFGGLIELSESEALKLVRKLTIQHHDWNRSIRETRAALAEVRAADATLKKPEGRCPYCLTYNGHQDGCTHAAEVKGE